MSEINIQAKDGSGTFMGYLAKPEGGGPNGGHECQLCAECVSHTRKATTAWPAAHNPRG